MLLLLLVVVRAAVCWANASALRTPTQLWNEVVAEWESAQHEQAVETLQELLRVDPNHHDVHLALGAIHHQLVGLQVKSHAFQKKDGLIS